MNLKKEIIQNRFDTLYLKNMMAICAAKILEQHTETISEAARGMALKEIKNQFPDDDFFDVSAPDFDPQELLKLVKKFES